MRSTFEEVLHVFQGTIHTENNMEKHWHAN